MIAILGAGISGLVTGWYLEKNNIPYTIFEASGQAGGYLQTVQKGGYLLELAANSLLCDTELLEMLQDFGLKDEIIRANEVSKFRYIYKKGNYRKLPASPPALLLSSFFSWKTKWKIWKERSLKSRTHPKETLSQFFERRFGEEILDYALTPFVSGIYAGDPANLLLAPTFPILAEYEAKYGSVLKGLIANKNGERKQSISFRKGMQQLPLQLAQKLNISYNTPIRIIKKEGEHFSLEHEKGRIKAKQVVITTPAKASADLLKALHPNIAVKLQSLRYPPMAVLHSVFKKADVGRKLDGFGALHPAIEKPFSAGSIWSSSVFEGRCKPDEVLLTSFVGGELFKQNALLPPQKIQEKVTKELQFLYQIKGEPIYQHCKRWQASIPQYDRNSLGMNDWVTKLAQDQLFVCANWHAGVSVADCMKKAKKLAMQLALV